MAKTHRRTLRKGAAPRNRAPFVPLTCVSESRSRARKPFHSVFPSAWPYLGSSRPSWLWQRARNCRSRIGTGFGVSALRRVVDETKSHDVLPEERVPTICENPPPRPPKRGCAENPHAFRTVDLCFRVPLEGPKALSLRFPRDLALVGSSRPSWLWQRARNCRSRIEVGCGGPAFRRMLVRAVPSLHAFRGRREAPRRSVFRMVQRGLSLTLSLGFKDSEKAPCASLWGKCRSTNTGGSHASSTSFSGSLPRSP